MYGKYFLKAQTDEEYKNWRHSRTGVIYDVHSEQDVINFAIKLKALRNFDVGENNCHFYYFPNIGKDLCGLCAHGHHSLQDGMTLMQSLNCMTDESRDLKTRDSVYPFVERKPLNFLQNFMLYATLPLGIRATLSHYYSKKPDVNCIKKHDIYCSGKYNACNSVEISMEKVKNYSKASGATVNDLMMSIISVCFRKYFELKNDP